MQEKSLIDKKEVTFMNILQSIENAVNYLSEAIRRIFGPSDDMYPVIGVNPFEGDPYKESNWED